MGHTPPFQRKVNTVFQSYALFQHMTVYQNIAFGLEMEGAKPDEIKSRVGRALEMVQLTGMERRRPRQLSGGQQQRVAVARALVNNPAIIMADEPTGNLDSKVGKEIMSLLLNLNKDLGTTLIIVTHDPKIAEQTQRVIRLRDGEIDLGVEENDVKK